MFSTIKRRLGKIRTNLDVNILILSKHVIKFKRFPEKQQMFVIYFVVRNDLIPTIP